jgi:cell division transport system permease protein
VLMVASASADWSSAISREATIQVKPRSGRNMESDLAEAAALARRDAAVASVEIISATDSTKLLEPWLGAGLQSSDLPVPRLIELRLADNTTGLADLKAAITKALPNAALDDHRPWLDRLSAMANALVAIGIVLLVLVLIATGLAVAFATRGAMAGNKDIIGVLNLVGAEDRFIAREFQGHFLRLGLEGGAIGAIAALAFYLIGGKLLDVILTDDGSAQVDAMFGSFGLGWSGIAAILAIIVLVGALAALVSRRTVFQQLGETG